MDATMIEFENWVLNANANMDRAGVPHSKRMSVLVREWEKLTGEKIGKDGKKHLFLSQYFQTNSRIQDPSIGPVWHSVYYHDHCFWKITVPFIFGRFEYRPIDWLTDVPKSIRDGIGYVSSNQSEYLKVWADAFDFGYGFDEKMGRREPTEFGEKIFVSGRQYLESSVSLLLGTNPNPAALMQARMATEMFLKAFIFFNDPASLTDTEAKKNQPSFR
jgi:hypothetical protein